MIYIFNNTSLFNDIELNINRIIPNSKLTTRFRGDEHYYIIISGINYFEKIPLNYDLFQFEQMENIIFECNYKIYINLLKNANNVYDFSNYNTNYLKEKYNLTNISYLPLYQYKYNNYYPLKIDIKQKKNDVIFIGSLNKRRDNILDKLKIIKKNNKLNNDEKTKLLTNSKIYINIHFYDNSVLEIERILEGLKNKCLIISERSKDIELDNLYSNMIIFYDDINDLEKKINYYLSNDDEYFNLIKKFYENFIKINMEYPICDEILNKYNNINNNYNDIPELEPYHKMMNLKSNNKNNINTLEIPKKPLFEDLPKITLITITKNREIFFDFMIDNFLNYKYPDKENKIEWIILDDSTNDNTDYFKKYKNKYNIMYIYKGNNYYEENNLTIADKRNDAVSYSNSNIIIHMDDDDYYFSDSLITKVKLLINYNKTDDIKCIGTSGLGIYNLVKNNSYFIEYSNISEASMCYFKSFWEEFKFYENLNGEGYSFLKNRYKNVCKIPYEFNLIVINHNKNITQNIRQVNKTVVDSNKILNYFNYYTIELLNKIRVKLKLV